MSFLSSLAQRRRILAATACATLAFFAAQQPSRAEPPAAAEAPKYLRFAEANDGIAKQLQTSIVTFKNDAGVKVDLIGAVHIADHAYFDALNDRFKQYDAVLYEMVKPKEMEGVQMEGRAPSAVGMMQRFMQNQLELEFQLDRIDYTPDNFVHADLDAETFAERQAARGENMLTLMLNTMMREMNNAQNGQAAQNQIGIMDLIEALQSPDRSRQLKLVLARQFTGMEEALDGMGGADGSVILDERNKHALEVLRQQMDAGKKNLAIFYGAAHLHGMEDLMTGLMGFKQVGEPEWIVAWDMTDRRQLAPPPLPPAIEPGAPTPRELQTTRPTSRPN